MCPLPRGLGAIPPSCLVPLRANAEGKGSNACRWFDVRGVILHTGGLGGGWGAGKGEKGANEDSLSFRYR